RSDKDASAASSVADRQIARATQVLFLFPRPRRPGKACGLLKPGTRTPGTCLSFHAPEAQPFRTAPPPSPQHFSLQHQVALLPQEKLPEASFLLQRLPAQLLSPPRPPLPVAWLPQRARWQSESFGPGVPEQRGRALRKHRLGQTKARILRLLPAPA